GFQFFMPLAGFGAAASLREIVAAFDHWIAFGLLALVGGRMILDGWRGGGERPGGGEFFEFNRMWIPAVATSIDALAVGAGLKFSGAPILVPAAAMGVVTAAASAAGVCFGKSLGKLAGTRALSVAGGVAIILIGANILREHLTGS
ncbi:MAG: manganese efflux pump, partial [Lentisphaeria bacterium]|nr:manganese efflux pump [Lentisphaeria bacterium]